MSDTQQSTAPVTETSDASESTEDEALATYEQRVQSAYDEIREEEASAKDADPVPTPRETPAAKSATAPDAIAKAREERAARLAKLKEQEAAAVDEQGRRAAPDKAARFEVDEIDQLRAAAARAAELEQAFASPEAFLKAARARGVKEDDLVAWIKEGIEDPSRDAAVRARNELHPELVSMKRQLDAQNEQIAALLNERQTQAVESAEQRAQETILSSLDAGKDTMPLSSGFLAKHGRGEFLKLVYAAADRVPQGAGEQALLDTVEEYLEQLVGFVPAPAPAASPSRATPPAAAKAKTLSNSLASSRASVVEDEDDFVEDYDERVRRAAESLFG